MSISRSQGFHGADVSPLFRFFDEFNNHLSAHDGGSSNHNQRAVRTVRRNFDVYETKATYELVGELPGFEQKDVNVEFTDPTTLVVKGHVQRQYGVGDGQVAQGRITADVGEGQQSHKATVEDEGQEEGQQEGQQVAKSQAEEENTNNHQQKARYWVAERTVGDFYRYFEFPAPVDQESVKANFKNGILSISVPKTKPQQPKKITIQS